jgi:hypothetical protein
MNLSSRFASSDLWRAPLLRLLAINCAAGIAIALITVAGLLVVNPGDLRRLMLQDEAAVVAFALLVFGFVVTFASWVMGTAIMRIGTDR